MRQLFDEDAAGVLAAARANANSLAGCVMQNVEFDAEHSGALMALKVEGAVFLGCRFQNSNVAAHLIANGATVMPRLRGRADARPYMATRARLYTVDELLEGFVTDQPGSFEACIDGRIYAHFDELRSQGRVHIEEALAQRVHDHAIDDAVEHVLFDEDADWNLTDDPAQRVPKRVVGVMGGHALHRGDPLYRTVAELGRALAKAGYFVATGGGPGAMEAANLGAWMSVHPAPALNEAIDHLATAPIYSQPGAADTHAYLVAGESVRERFAVDDLAGRRHRRSLAVPTWFYGHEPTNQFATDIAKYFSNSIREDGLLTVATHGIVFAPGRAGTIQEVFQDLCQNHYGTTRVRFAAGQRPLKAVSPMVFLGDDDYWRNQMPVLGLIEALGHTSDPPKQYLNLLHVDTDPASIVRWLAEHPPQGYGNASAH